MTARDQLSRLMLRAREADRLAAENAGLRRELSRARRSLEQSREARDRWKERCFQAEWECGVRPHPHPGLLKKEVAA